MKSIMIRDATFLTPSLRRGRGDLLVEDGTITAVVPSGLRARAAEELDGSRFVVVPGLVNAHFHSQSLVARGLCKDLAISDWMADTEQGRLQKRVSDYVDGCAPDRFITAAAYGFGELAREGITCTQDSGLGEQSPELYAEAAERIGIRALIDGYGAELAEERSPRVRYSAHLPEDEDVKEELAEAIRRARRDRRILTTHCLETKDRLAQITNDFGKSTVSVFDEHGLLRAPTLLFHLVHASPADIELLAARGVAVAHCPESNLATGTGIAPIAAMLDKGIRVGLGTDWAETDLWATMRLAYLLLKTTAGPTRFSAETIWRMATVEGARALGFDRVGEIREGFAADLTFLEIDDVELAPHVDGEDFSTFAHGLLQRVSRRHVAHVMVDGDFIVRDRRLVRADESALRAAFANVAREAITDPASSSST